MRETYTRFQCMFYKVNLKQLSKYYGGKYYLAYKKSCTILFIIFIYEKNPIFLTNMRSTYTSIQHRSLFGCLKC